MPEFKCINRDCKNHNKIQLCTKVSFKWNTETKKFDMPFGEQTLCYICGIKMEYIDKKEKKVPNIYLTGFKQMTLDQKKEVLKKRANQHNKKKMKDRVQEVKRKFGIEK